MQLASHVGFTETSTVFFFAKSLLVWFSDSFGRWISKKMGDLVIQNHAQVKRALIVS